MHLIFATDGIKKEVDDTINQLQGVYLPFEIKEEGTAGLPKGKCSVQLQVRPVQLWDVIFPREHKDLILSTIVGQHPKMNTEKFKVNSFLGKMVQKKLGLQPIPEYDLTKRLPQCFRHTNVIPIGIKEDYDFEDGTEAL